MDDLNLGLSSAPRLRTDEHVKTGSSRKKRIVIASLLSLLLPGLGQLYNRRPWLGIAMAISFPVFAFVAGSARLLLHFWTLVGFFGITLLWRFVVIVDAALAAREERPPGAQKAHSMSILLSATVVIVAAGVFPSIGQFHWIFPQFRAYKITSGSMCPTICEGDRIVADATAYAKNGPSRGDVILLRHRSSQQLFIKRVVGIAGDAIAPGPGDTIVVNGKPVAWPKACRDSHPQSHRDPPTFAASQVPENSLFVLGDNLGSSFDSRFDEFGAVTLDQVRGKPLFVYWSTEKSRIGCPIR